MLICQGLVSFTHITQLINVRYVLCEGDSVKTTTDVFCMIENLTMLYVISGFWCSVNEICILLEYFAA